MIETGTTFKMGQAEMEMLFDGEGAPTFRVGVFVMDGEKPLVGARVKIVDAETFDTMEIVETDESGFASFVEPPAGQDAMFVVTVGGVTKSAPMGRLSPANIDFGKPGLGVIVGATAALGFGYLALSLLS